MDIRNFCIIAHIDHGKSTLADRMMELTGTVEKREMKSQLLDSMELEREKGITIKLTPVRMEWGECELNLIDTPGHVDFSYEVSRSLAACEGAVLVVDASQGIQAQTLANVYLALEADLAIIPVINKIDLPAADVPRVTAEICGLLGCSEDEVLKVSAKTGEGVAEVLDAVVARVPRPAGVADAPLRALIFDSYYDAYKGVVVYIRIVDGKVSTGDKIKFMAGGDVFTVTECGTLKATQFDPTGALSAGEVGYIAASIYTGICTDTGCFKYSNVTPRTMRIAVELPNSSINDG